MVEPFKYHIVTLAHFANSAKNPLTIQGLSLILNFEPDAGETIFTIARFWPESIVILGLPTLAAFLLYDNGFVLFGAMRTCVFAMIFLGRFQS